MIRTYDVIPDASASDYIAHRTERGGAYKIKGKLLGWVVRTTEPLRPKIDFSFVKIRFLGLGSVVLTKEYQRIKSSVLK